MQNGNNAEQANARFYKTFFEVAFEAADTVSIWWQPMLKSVGRTHLELATLQAKTAQAALVWSSAMASARQPADLVMANLAFCKSVADHCGEVVPRVSEAMSDSADSVAAFQLLAMPSRRAKDVMVITDADDDVIEPRRRRVA